MPDRLVRLQAQWTDPSPVRRTEQKLKLTCDENLKKGDVFSELLEISLENIEQSQLFAYRKLIISCGDACLLVSPKGLSA